MRRNVRNEKVIRAMTIGLATMLATTSMPMSVFADEETNGGESQGMEESQVPAPAPTEGSAEGQTVEIHIESTGVVPQEVTTAQNAVEPAATAISNAQGVVPAPTPTYDTGSLNQNLSNAAADVSDTTPLPAENSGAQVNQNVQNVDGQLTILAGAMKQIDAIATDIVEDKALPAADTIAQGVTTSIEFEFDENNQPVYEKDVDGKPIQAVDADGKPLFETVLDADGKPKQVVDADGNPQFEMNEDGTYVMDNNGNPVPKYEKKAVYVQKIKVITPKAGTGENSGENQGKSQGESQTGNANVTAAKSNLDLAEDYANKAALLGQNSDNEEDAKRNKILAEGAIKDAGKAVEAATNEVEAARKAYNEAKAKAALAEEEVKKAEAALKGAKQYSSAAVEELQNAKDEAERLKIAAQKAYDDFAGSAENKSLIEKIKVAQDELQNQIDSNLANGESVSRHNYAKLARKLCNLLVEYYVKNDADYSGEFVIGQDFTTELISGWTQVDGVDENGDPILSECEDLGDGKYNHIYEAQTTPLDDDNAKADTRYKDHWISYFIDGEKSGTDRWTNFGFNFVVVKYKDKDGKEVTKYFDYKPDYTDGTFGIFERSFEYIEETYKEAVEAVAAVEGVEGVEGQEYIAHVDAVPESWKTEDGSKTYAATETTHTIDILGEEGEKTGFYAIDTNLSTDVSTDADKAVTAPVNTDNTKGNVRTQVSYQEVADSAVTTYEKGTYDYIDGYNKKTTTKTENAKTKEALKKIVDSYEQEGKKISKVEVPIFYFFSYEVDLDKVNWFDELCAKVDKYLGGDGLEIKISYQEDDPTNPITHKEAGIYEVVSKNYTETTTTTTSNKNTSKNYGYSTGNVITYKWHTGEKEATEARDKKVKELEDAGYTNVVGTVKSKKVFEDGWKRTTYYYEVTYDSVSNSNQTVTKEVSRKQYAADVYTNYTPGQEEVKGQEYIAHVDAVDPVPLVIGNEELKIQTGIQWKSMKESYNEAKENGTLKTKDDNATVTADLRNKNIFDLVFDKVSAAWTNAKDLDEKVDAIASTHFTQTGSKTAGSETTKNAALTGETQINEKLADAPVVSFDDDEDLEYISLNGNEYEYTPAEGSNAEKANNILSSLKEKLDEAESKLSALKNKVNQVADFIRNITIAEKPGGSTTDDPGQTDPGQQNDDPGKQNDGPGKKDDEPGKKDDEPGKKDDEPGKKDDEPGKKDDEPGKKDDEPGKKDDEPGKKDDEPGKKDDKPGRTDPGSGTIIGGGTDIGGGAGTGEDSGSGSGSSGTTTYTYTTSIATGAGSEVIPLMTLTDTGAGTGAGRTVAGRTAASRSGVLGVRTEDDNASKGDSSKDKKTVVAKAVKGTKTEKKETKDLAKANTGSAKVTVKIKENEVPLSATPYEKGFGLNWLWLLAVAAAGGAGYAGYEKHRRKVNAASVEENKTEN